MTSTMNGEAAAPFGAGYKELSKLVEMNLGPDIAALLRNETPEAEVQTMWLGSAVEMNDGSWMGPPGSTQVHFFGDRFFRTTRVHESS